MSDCTEPHPPQADDGRAGEGRETLEGRHSMGESQENVRKVGTP